MRIPYVIYAAICVLCSFWFVKSAKNVLGINWVIAGVIFCFGCGIFCFFTPEIHEWLDEKRWRMRNRQ